MVLRILSSLRTDPLSKLLVFFVLAVLLCNGESSEARQNVAVKHETHTGAEQRAVLTDPALADLEPLVKSSVSVLAEVARLEEMLAMLEYERTKAGWKVIGSLRGGFVDEQLTNDERRRYYPSQVSAGLTYPLLGKRQEEKNRLLELQAGARNEQLRVAIKKRDSLESLRLSYILLWAAELKIELADAFLSDGENSLKLLEKRVGTGHLLRADYLEFVSTLDLVFRERSLNLNMAVRARELIDALTGVKLDSPLPHPPDLPGSCEQIDQAVSKLADDPEILLYQNDVELQMETLAHSTAIDVKGDFTVQGMVGSSEEVTSDHGYGGMVSLNFSLPVHPFSTDSANRAVQQRRLQRFQRELQVKTEELEQVVKDRFRNREVELANIQFARTRLSAATELLREKTLRMDRIAGDALEQLQKARYNYYRVAVEFTEAESRLLNSSARILRFCPAITQNRVVSVEFGHSVVRPLFESQEKQKHTASVGKRQPVSPQEKADLAVYLWQSGAFLDGSEPVEVLKEHQINRVLFSLNADQLQELKSEEGKERLRKLLGTCRIAGISPGVLLGEPTWILPEQRQYLLEILSAMNEFPLDRVHLDLEPAQLDLERYGLNYLGAQLLRTVQLAVEISDHPVELSIHPRMLSTEEIDICFGCGLSNLDLEKVVVMIYRTDLAEVQEKMMEFTRNFPDLRLAVAQSVETILGPNNSYAHHGIEVLRDSVRQLMMGGDHERWRGDVYIQDWTSLQKLSEPTLMTISRDDES